MIFFKNLFYCYFFLKGALKFRKQDFNTAYSLLTKAIKYTKYDNDELFCQYYGQTLLILGKPEESFVFLSKAYYLLEKKGWQVTNKEESRLAQNTLDALNHLYENFHLKVDNFNQKKISINEKI